MSGGEWQRLIVAHLGVMGVLLLVARVVGFELVRGEDPLTALRRLQFTIRDILLWTMALAKSGGRAVDYWVR